jgi:hypothetical protein
MLARWGRVRMEINTLRQEVALIITATELANGNNNMTVITI